MKFFLRNEGACGLGVPVEKMSLFLYCWGRIGRPLGGAVEHLLGGALATLWDEKGAGAGR